jgi:hypothetical protein
MSDLLQINVNAHTERKNGLTYLSWAWAWAEVLKVDPIACWQPMTFGPKDSPVPYLAMPDTSMMVGVQVTIKGITRACLLPVMDHRNKAIKNPDAFQVNTALMRCLAKAIAMHGLGLYIYAGEDLPEGEEKPEDKKPTGTHNAPRMAFEALQPEVQDHLRKVAPTVVAAVEADNCANAIALMEMVADNWPEDDRIKPAIWSLLDSKTRSAIKAHQAKE